MKLQWILIAILMFVGLNVEAQVGMLPQAAFQIPLPAPVTNVEIPNRIPPLVPVAANPLNLPAVEAAVAKANPIIETCNASAKKASNICVAATSPEIQTGIVAVTGILSAIDMASSTNQSCKKFGDALDIAKTAMTAYTLACGIVQRNCDNSCAPVQSALDAVVAAGMPNIEKQTEEYALTKRKCAGYKLSLVAAGAGIMSILTESLIGQKCQKETAAVDCAKDPMNPTCQKALDCSKAENANNTTCICQKAPNTPGCSTYTGDSYAAVQSGSGLSQSDGLDAGKLDLNAPSSNADGMISPNGNFSNSGAGSLSGSGGGGSGGGGGGLSGGGVDGNKNAPKGQSKAINTNILSGYEGGGGGGGMRGGGYGSASSDNSGLRAYLPNGAKDPSRNPAMQLFGNGEVTGAGSKSNFEKVNERYGDAKGTLIAP